MAAYTVVESEDNFELREYPELTLATTQMNSYGEGKDGSFMRLFRYISGDNVDVDYCSLAEMNRSCSNLEGRLMPRTA